MDHKDQDIFVCIRNRDHAGLAEWLLFLLEMANEDAQRGLTGVMRYDGAILVPLLQLGDASFSKALLSDPRVRKAMTDKSVQHDDWLLNLAVKDPLRLAAGLGPRLGPGGDAPPLHASSHDSGAHVRQDSRVSARSEAGGRR